MPKKSISNSKTNNNSAFFQSSAGEKTSNQPDMPAKGEVISNFIARRPIVPAKDSNGQQIFIYATEQESPEESRRGCFTEFTGKYVV